MQIRYVKHKYEVSPGVESYRRVLQIKEYFYDDSQHQHFRWVDVPTATEEE